jgi:hypothetical protein
MNRTIIGTMLILGATLTAAHADTWVFRDTLRPNGHDRSMAAKRADGRKCGASRGGHDFGDAIAESLTQCMQARGWALDHIIPDPPSIHVRGPSYDPGPSIDNSSNDDWVARQRDQDNMQQMINQQQQNDIQQMNTDQFNQQQQMINNDRLND